MKKRRLKTRRRRRRRRRRIPERSDTPITVGGGGGGQISDNIRHTYVRFDHTYYSDTPAESGRKYYAKPGDQLNYLRFEDGKEVGLSTLLGTSVN